MRRMNRITALLMTAFMSLSLIACGSTDEAPDSPAVNEIYPDKEGCAIGEMGDLMHTYFFDYMVNSAYLCEQYESYSPKEGWDLLVAEVTITNTHSETISMYDTDFQVQWNDEAEDAFNVPITYYVDTTETISPDIFPYEYELEKKDSRTGLLVFEVPEGKNEFSISYLEYFDDDTTGDLFFVYFPATKKTN